MKNKLILVVFISLIPELLLAQNYCTRILDDANYYLQKNSIDSALQRLKDLETCDYKDKLLLERQKLQTDIYTKIIKQKQEADIAKNDANKARDEANKSAGEASYNLAKLYEEKSSTALDKHNYVEAWLYNQEALNQAAIAKRKLPKSIGRLFLNEMSPDTLLTNTIYNTDSKIFDISFNKNDNLLGFTYKQTYDNKISNYLYSHKLIYQKKGASQIEDMDMDLDYKFNDIANVLVANNRLLIKDEINKDTSCLLYCEFEDKISLKHKFYLPKVSLIAFSKDGMKFIIRFEQSKLFRIYHNLSQTSNEVLFNDFYIDVPNTISSLVFNSDGNKFAVSDVDGNVSIYKADGEFYKKAVNQFKFENNKITELAFSTNSKYLAIGMNDGKIKLKSLENNITIDGISEIIKPVKCIAFSPDGKIIASGNVNGDVSIWYIKSDQLTQVAIIPLHLGQISTLIFSHDGKYLISNSSDGTIKKINFKPKFLDLPEIDMVTFLGNENSDYSNAIRNKLYNESFNKLYYKLEQMALTKTNVLEAEIADAAYFGHKVFHSFVYKSTITRDNNSNLWYEKYYQDGSYVVMRKLKEKNRNKIWIYLYDSSHNFFIRLPLKKDSAIQVFLDKNWVNFYTDFTSGDSNSYSIGIGNIHETIDGNLLSLNKKNDTLLLDSSKIRYSLRGGWIEYNNQYGWCKLVYVNPWNLIRSPQILDWEGRLVTYSDVSINKEGNYQEVYASTTVNLEFDWNIDTDKGKLESQFYCPGCIIQFYYGLKDIFSNCIVSTAIAPPYFEATSGRVNIMFTAPSTPGIYYINQTFTLDYFCHEDQKSFHNNDIENSIAVIRVK